MYPFLHFISHIIITPFMLFAKKNGRGPDPIADVENELQTMNITSG